MKASRLVVVGLLLGLLVTPIAWADTDTGDKEGLWGLDWVDEVVSWIVGLITEGPDPIGTRVDLPSPTNPTTQELQSTPPEDERSPAIDPNSST